ncbi:MAG: hypothetical protein AB7I29_12530 [Geobacter sp.]
MNMRTMTIHLPEDVAHILEVRMAIDGVRLPEGVELLLTKLVEDFKERTATA